MAIPSARRSFPGAHDQDAGERDLATRLRRHAAGLERHSRSPLCATLMRGAAEDIDADGVVSRAFAGIPLPRGQAPGLRLLAALHRLVLGGEVPALARFYPSGDGGAQLAAVWPVARAVIEDRFLEVRAALRQGVQTNEPGRSAVLFGVLLLAAQRHGLALRLLEPGASGGLNLLADRYGYALRETPLSLIGDPGSPLRFIEPWVGTPVADPQAAASRLDIPARAGCDLHPLDPADPDDRMTLRSYIWPDELERMHRLDAALAVAKSGRITVERASAAPWLKARLDEPMPGTATVVWQSVFAQYLPAAERDSIAAVIAAAGGRARDPLLWARMEPGEDPVAGFEITLASWPDAGEVELLGHAGDHGPPVTWI
ncbi:MAG: DUF2332 domain-containing protein [Solirubrobacteraceae bacterium]